MNAGMEMMNHLITDDASMLLSSIFLPEGMEKKVTKRRKKATREIREEAKKRRLNDGQVEFLEKSFIADRKLDTGRKIKLAEEAGLDPKQVSVWFQNRRTRWKSKRMEEDYHNLRSLHDTDVVQIHHLEAQIMKLRQEVSEAEREISELYYKYICSGGGGGGEFSSSTASTAGYSMNEGYSAAWGEFDPAGGMDGYNNNYSNYNNYIPDEMTGGDFYRL